MILRREGWRYVKYLRFQPGYKRANKPIGVERHPTGSGSHEGYTMTSAEQDASGAVMSRERAVVVTGLGMVTSIGTGREEFWDALLAGRCGFAPVSSFDTSRYSVHTGGEIKDFNPRNYVFKLV